MLQAWLERLTDFSRRRGGERRDAVGVDYAAETFAEGGLVEIHYQAHSQVHQPQIGEYLFGVDGCDVFYRF